MLKMNFLFWISSEYALSSVNVMVLCWLCEHWHRRSNRGRSYCKTHWIQEEDISVIQSCLKCRGKEFSIGTLSCTVQYSTELPYHCWIRSGNCRLTSQVILSLGLLGIILSGVNVIRYSVV